jgi:NAD(P)-dependent dehydrogenase (short-subunit alcohol dehydrogenase family)
MQLTDRVALVTGAGSGIGKAAALLLADAGARIGVLSRDEDEVNQVVREIEQAGGEAIPIIADISIVEDMQRSYRQIQDQWGRLDIVFANAGINGKWAPIDELEPEDWDQVFNVNMRGTFLTIKYAVPYMKQRGGSIIITSSINGTRVFSNAGASAYATTKAGQVAFGKMMALELAKHRIRVNVICPGAIESQIDENTERVNLDEAREPAEYPEGAIPLTDGQPGRAEQVADLVLFLASDRSSHITGTEMWIDGAQSLLLG